MSGRRIEITRGYVLAARAERHAVRPHIGVSGKSAQEPSLARRIGPVRMQHYVDAAEYGNRDLSGGLDQFWLTGNLRISPREQNSTRSECRLVGRMG